MNANQIVSYYNKIKKNSDFLKNEIHLNPNNISILFNCFLLDKNENSDDFYNFIFYNLNKYEKRLGLFSNVLSDNLTVYKNILLIEKFNEFIDKKIYHNQSKDIDDIYYDRKNVELLKNFSAHICFDIIDSLTYKNLKRTDYLLNHSIDNNLINLLFNNIKSLDNDSINYCEKHLLFNFIFENNIKLDQKNKNYFLKALNNDLIYGFSSQMIEKILLHNQDLSDKKNIENINSFFLLMKKNFNYEQKDINELVNKKIQSIKDNIILNKSNNPYLIGISDIIKPNERYEKVIYYLNQALKSYQNNILKIS